MASRFMERLLDGPGGGDSGGPAAVLADQARSPELLVLPLTPSRQATADALSAPDWGLLMELCDKVNSDVSTCVVRRRNLVAR